MKALVFNPYGIGDVLNTLPLITALKERGRVNEVAFVTNSRSAQVLENNPYIDSVLLYDRDRLKGKFLEQVRFFSSLRRTRADVAFDLTLNRNLGFLLMLAGIRVRVGFDYSGRGTFLTRKIRLEEFTRPIPAEYARLYQLLFPEDPPVDPAEFPPKIYLTEQERRFAEYLVYNLGFDEVRIVSVFPGGGASWGKERIRKQWGGDRFLALIEKILKSEENLIVMVLGDEKDKETLSLPISLLRGRRCFDLRGRLSLRESLSVMARSSLVVCNEGGPGHMASALGVPVVIVLGPVPGEVYAPQYSTAEVRLVSANLECQPCYRRFRMPECPRDYACLKAVSVEEVFSQCIPFLQGSQ